MKPTNEGGKELRNDEASNVVTDSNNRGRKRRGAGAASTPGRRRRVMGLSPAAASGVGRPSSRCSFGTLTTRSENRRRPARCRAFLNRFEKENPGIKVVSVQVPYGDLLDKFIAAAAAGNPPALLRSDIAWVPTLAADGALLNMSRQKWAQPILKAALPGPLSTNYYQGSYYGIPDDTNTQAMFWNKTEFAAAGLSGPPTTLTQLWADAAKLTNSAKGQFGLSVGGTDLWNVAPYIWSDGERSPIRASPAPPGT